MRILYASDVDPNPNSGAAGTDLQTIKALELCGHQVDTLWRSDFSQRVRHPGLHSLLELPWSMYRSIAAACEQASYDAVIANQPFAYLVAKKFRTREHRPVVVIRSHGFEAHMNGVLAQWQRELGVKQRAGWKAPLGSILDHGVLRACRQAAENADGVLVNSRADKAFIESTYRLRGCSVACVPQAPPPGFLATAAQPLTARRLNHLVFVGPAQFYKGIDIMVPAVHQLLRKYANPTFTWVCPAADIGVIRGLFSGTAEVRLRLLPYGAQDELMGVLDTCGIFIFPSLFEGFGKAPLEAMARGLCVVSSRVGGMADIIDDGRDGVLVPPGDVRALAKEVGDLLDDFPRALSMAELARATASKYTWERTGQEISRWLAGLERKQDSD